MNNRIYCRSNGFHHENIRRRIRYLLVLAVLAAFCVITVLNINTGNVDISIPKILKIIFLREGNEMEYNIIWKIRLPRILMAAILGRSTFSFRIFITDLL